MYKTYKFRMYPTDEQRQLIHKTFGCVRFIYNYFLDKCKNNGCIKDFDMCKKIKELYVEYPFLKEVDSCSLRCSVFNLEDSYKNFFSKRSNYPKFKNRYNKQSYRTICMKRTCKGKEYANIELDLINKIIKLPKLGNVCIRGYRNLDMINGRIISATIERETTNKYYVCVLINEVELKREKIKPKSIVGIDLGIKDLVVTSDGEKYLNPKEIEKYEKRIKNFQRKLSRQEKGSCNYKKTKIRLARIYSKLKNSRKHNLISVVNKIVKEHDIIVSETLKVKEMSSNHSLAKKILDASFNKLCLLIKWKTEQQGKYYYQVDKYYPSSKTCSHCESKTNKTNNLGIRNWVCSECGNENDRDINASINIMYEGLRIHYQN